MIAEWLQYLLGQWEDWGSNLSLVICLRLVCYRINFLDRHKRVRQCPLSTVTCSNSQSLGTLNDLLWPPCWWVWWTGWTWQMTICCSRPMLPHGGSGVMLGWLRRGCPSSTLQQVHGQAGPGQQNAAQGPSVVPPSPTGLNTHTQQVNYGSPGHTYNTHNTYTLLITRPSSRKTDRTLTILSLHFNGHFPGGPGLASTSMSPYWILLELRIMVVVVTTEAIRRA